MQKPLLGPGKNEQEVGEMKIPMQIPAIGQPQQQVDASQATQQMCKMCGCKHFKQVVTLGVVSVVAPGNKTGRSVLTVAPAYLCCECGLEFGADIEGIRN
jgi:hypothetical protein